MLLRQLQIYAKVYTKILFLLKIVVVERANHNIDLYSSNVIGTELFALLFFSTASCCFVKSVLSVVQRVFAFFLWNIAKLLLLMRYRNIFIMSSQSFQQFVFMHRLASRLICNRIVICHLWLDRCLLSRSVKLCWRYYFSSSLLSSPLSPSPKYILLNIVKILHEKRSRTLFKNRIKIKTNYIILNSDPFAIFISATFFMFRFLFSIFV
jgi:hypothetical protein